MKITLQIARMKVKARVSCGVFLLPKVDYETSRDVVGDAIF